MHNFQKPAPSYAFTVKIREFTASEMRALEGANKNRSVNIVVFLCLLFCIYYNDRILMLPLIMVK